MRAWRSAETAYGRSSWTARRRWRPVGYLTVRTTGDGMYEVRGLLLPEVGALLVEALDAAADEIYRQERAMEREADAATEREAAREADAAIGDAGTRGRPRRRPRRRLHPRPRPHADPGGVRGSSGTTRSGRGSRIARRRRCNWCSTP